MNREELIEAARLAYVEAWEEEDARTTFNSAQRSEHARSRAGIVAALAVFEQAHTLTDDEREAAKAEAAAAVREEGQGHG